MGVPSEQLMTEAPPVLTDEAEVDQAVDAVVVVDAALNVSAWSKAAAELYGVSSSEAIGRPFSDHVSCYPRNTHRWQMDGKTGPGADDEADFSLEAIGLVDGPA